MKQIFFFCLMSLVMTAARARAQLWFSEDFDHGSVFDNAYEKWQLVDGISDYWKVSNGVAQTIIYKTYRMSTIVPYDQWWGAAHMPYQVNLIFESQDVSDKNFALGVRDKDNFYDVHFYGGKIIIEDIRNGLSIKQHVASLALNVGHFYQVKIDYTVDGFKIYLDNNLVISSPDSWAPIQAGKFGLKVSAGSVTPSRSQLDQIRVSSLIDTAPKFKQTDQRWASEIYDHVDSWSAQPDISRWGCALSSAAMILRFHGFDELDGQELQVGNLNQWLKQQPDGYLGNGLLNWLAISRLTYLLSQNSTSNLPVLEIKYLQSDELTMMTSLHEYLAASPQIAMGQGHFFVIDNYNELVQDFAIRDPLFSHQWLKQKSAFESLRLFTPSHTDLSYILLQLPRELSVDVSDELGQTPAAWQEVTEWLFGQEESLGVDDQLFVYTKPSSQKLKIAIQGASLSQEVLSKVQLFVYQTDGQVQVFTLSDWLKSQYDLRQIARINWQLDYQTAAASQTQVETVSRDPQEMQIEYLQNLTVAADAAFASHQLTFYLYYRLQQLVLAVRTHLDYFFVLEQFLNFYRQELGDLGK